MVDLEVLKLYGIDADGLKARFNMDREKYSDEIKALINRIRFRVQGGRDHNLETYQVFWSMDQAVDAAFKQITPTMLSTLRDKEFTEEGLNDILRQWGMNPKDVIYEVPDAKSPNKTIKGVNAPAFTRIMVPLVLAYLKIRWARLTNDLKMVPLFKYEAVISDAFSRLKCDTLTHRVEMMSRQMGYFETLKSSVWYTLLYGKCIQFPVEEWYKECAEVEADSPFEALEEKEVGGKKVKKIIVKEGIRYHMPHPTRTYIDQAFYTSQINTDTGPEYGGYWRTRRWSVILGNKNYYNLERVGFGEYAKWWNNKKTHSYWVNIGPGAGCSLEFPTATEVKAGGDLDQENHLNDWYSHDWGDKPIVITEHYEKLIPKEWGLGDYEYPVWFRFVLAADDTVIYAAPMGYAPMIFYGYDHVDGKTHNASMALEVLPFQDQFSNLMSQLLLTTRQNLANFSLVDSDILNQEDIKKIENWGEALYRNVVNLIPVSFKKFFQKQGSDPRSAVITHKFPIADTNQLIMSMNTILDTLERVLVMSSQEVGQAASHEQTREEVRNISANTSTRVTFTMQGISAAIEGWKHQIYAGLMAYGHDTFWAQVPMEEQIDPDALQKLGFTYVSDYNKAQRTAHVQVMNKTAIAYESFASNRDGQDRVDDVATATAMTALLDKMINHADLFGALGVDQVIEMLNKIARFAGFPRDFKLVNTGQTQGMQEQITGAMQEMAQVIQEQIGGMQQEVQEALGVITEKNVEQDESLQGLAQRVNKVLQAAEQIQVPMTAIE